MELLKGIYGKFCKRKNNYWKLQKKISFIIYLFILIVNGNKQWDGIKFFWAQLSDIVDLIPNQIQIFMIFFLS